MCSSFQALCLAMLLFMLVTGPQAASASCPVPSQLRNAGEDIIAALNADRVRDGLGKLKTSDHLSAIAQQYACQLAGARHFSHTGPDGSTLASRARDGGYEFCRLAENLALGQQTSKHVYSDWFQSSGHRKNMLRRGVTEIGLGIAASQPKRSRAMRLGALPQALAQLRDRGPYWVLLVGRPC